MPDDYERKIKLPANPKKPTHIEKPDYSPMTVKEYRSKNVDFSGKPWGFGIAAIVDFFVLLALQSGVRNDGSDADKIQIGIVNFAKIVLFILIGIAVLFLVINVIKFIKSNINYKTYLEKEKADYEKNKIKYAEYTKKHSAYLDEMRTYEECAAALKNEEDQVLEAIRDKITKNELTPAIEKLNEENDDFIDLSYCEDLSVIIDFIEKGRADTLKEALNLLEEKKQRDEQLERERREREDELERLEREREEDLKRLEREREEDIRRERRYREDEDRRRSEEAYKNKRDALSQCSRCAAIHGCRNYGKYPNCPNFRSR